MNLTVDVLDCLHASDMDAAAKLVRASNNGIALIELLELLWTTGAPRSKWLIAPVLERLEQLRPRPADG